LTVLVDDGDAAFWLELERVRVVPAGGGEARTFGIRESRAYRDRLVLRLDGVPDVDAAAALRGCRVEAEIDDVPELPEGEYYAAALVGMDVRDVAGRKIGVAREILPTGGVDVLIVDGAPSGPDGSGTETTEVMIPMAREILLEVDPVAGVITVDPPDGLIDLNPAGGGS